MQLARIDDAWMLLNKTPLYWWRKPLIYEIRAEEAIAKSYLFGNRGHRNRERLCIPCSDFQLSRGLSSKDNSRQHQWLKMNRSNDDGRNAFFSLQYHSWYSLAPMRKRLWNLESACTRGCRWRKTQRKVISSVDFWFIMDFILSPDCEWTIVHAWDSREQSECLKFSVNIFSACTRFIELEGHPTSRK